MTMPDRVVMNVIDMPRHVVVIPDLMFPETTLPDRRLKK
jgi:hypothetical protein